MNEEQFIQANISYDKLDDKEWRSVVCHIVKAHEKQFIPDMANRKQLNELVRKYTLAYFPEIKLTNQDLGDMIRYLQSDWYRRFNSCLTGL